MQLINNEFFSLIKVAEIKNIHKISCKKKVSARYFTQTKASSLFLAFFKIAKIRGHNDHNQKGQCLDLKFECILISD